jgi:DNA-binding response OmpR family regulator/anti-sigma regulatory factor (Ser/Thr protein kinase)
VSLPPARILVVEDEPALLAGYARILRSEGYDVLQSATGEDGWRICGEERPDLVLLDAMLPDLEGIEVCRRIKGDPEQAQTFVIMISGQRVSGDDQALGLEAGADGYLTKPIERRALVAHIRALLRIRESEERQRQLVAELTEANRRLEEYNRLKAELVANMSHELRTPLTAIIGFVQLVEMSQKGEPIPAPYATAFERILRNGKHLLALIDDVLDVAKIEAGRMRLHREHFDLTEVVQGAFRELQSLARTRGIDYSLEVEGELPLAFSDPLRIRQVVINLLSNAIKFTPKGSVSAELLPGERGTFRLVVRDTGVGIDEKSLGIIFERFRQVDGSMSRLAGGAGLGLSIVRQIVDLLGGTIEVESRVGSGSTFTVTLPLVAPDPEVRVADAASLVPALGAELGIGGGGAAGTEEPAVLAGGDSAPLVLIIEDDEDASALLSETIARAGYRVRLARSGARGLLLARELEPSAITLDVMMPGMDGWRVLQALKAEPRTAGIPVIVCSIVDNRPLGYRLGASDYLIKPIEPVQLTASLRSVSAEGNGHGGGYVLVVDDEHGVRELLLSALRRAGYDVRSATSGEMALQMVLKSPPRAMLVDLMMPPGMSGYELIARLRSDPATENMPVLVVTGKDMTRDDRKFISGQISDVIRKGDLLMSDLETRLRETLEDVGVKPIHGEDLVG